MQAKTPETIFLKDYQKPLYTIFSCKLDFHLIPERTLVRSSLKIAFNGGDFKHQDLLLDCQDIEIQSIKIDGRTLAASDWSLDAGKLVIKSPATARFELESNHIISPEKNKALEGLYISSGIFCTQNEAEGFRRITPFVDRPDVMSVFEVKITADKKKYPVLLCNGNQIESGDIGPSDHYAVWSDPHPKPSYLFAMVAGDLACQEDVFITKSNRSIKLAIYTNHGNVHLCDFAMRALKKAMAWDEQCFGLEYDLDLYMIVAVDDFNMGAMENKGLNIFNSKLILADPQTATDELLESIEAVVAHEYFHNWTGNRITCRDWFQLTLKEGLTVYRDQRFTADMTARGVKRIKDVSHLRQFQFPEDAGPLAHPIQPDKYMEINNFYTQTVYEKGAEVVRMIATLIGEDRFSHGITEYFRLYDGQAVTIDEFLGAMANVSDLDVAQFRRWYTTPGTPVLKVSCTYNQDDSMQLELEQQTSKTGEPLLMPVRVGFCSREQSTQDIRCSDPGVKKMSDGFLIAFGDKHQTYTFKNVKPDMVCAVLRGFSAPVQLEYKLDNEALVVLINYDSDDFTRWNAAQEFYSFVWEKRIEHLQAPVVPATSPQDELLFATFENLLHSDLEPLIKSWLISFPSESEMISRQPVADFRNTHLALTDLKRDLAEKFAELIESQIHIYAQAKNQSDSESVALRRLKNVLLEYFASLDKEENYEYILNQQSNAKNMTDELAAFRLLCDSISPFRDKAIDLFYKKWHKNDLVMDYYFSVLASSSHPDTLQTVEQLAKDKAFRFDNPNKIRSLYGSLTRNALIFNEGSGRGYAMLADVIMRLDLFNPAASSGLCRAFTKTGNLDVLRKGNILGQLEAILSNQNISTELYEIASSAMLPLKAESRA